MKSRFFFLTVSLILLTGVSCAPAQTLPPVATNLPQATSTPLEIVAQPQVTREAPTQTPFPVATSRGPNLEATDPKTVALASGSLQLIEFFRFT